jgi:LPS-assembly lipoprotein
MAGALSRRALLTGAMAAPMLAGCGFRPMYGGRSATSDGPAADGLAAVTVGLIPERSGQLLREALQERFERNGGGTAHRYDLQVSFGVGAEGIGYQHDNSITYLRYVGTAFYTLLAQDATRSTLTSGSARVVDGLNVIDEQYFAMDMEGEAVTRRLAEAVADQITLRLAAYFNQQAKRVG